MHKSKDTARGVRHLRRWRSVDIQLLELFVRIHRTRNVSSACAELGMSQPAASRGVGRLREIYGDALFVRQHRGVLPTPFADWLAPQVGAALAGLRGTIDAPKFEPATAQRTFAISMTDIGERFFLPRLLRRVSSEAPGVVVRAVGPSADVWNGLSSGAVDLAVGFLPEHGKQVHAQRLFHERFVYIARKGHAAFKKPLTVSVLRTLPHVLVSPAGTLHAAAVEKVLTSSRVRAPIALRVESFLSVGPIVVDTELVAVVPSNLARLVAEHLPLQFVPPPINFPGFDLEMAWHQRFHRDPGALWMRGLFLDLFRHD